MILKKKNILAILSSVIILVGGVCDRMAGPEKIDIDIAQGLTPVIS